MAEILLLPVLPQSSEQLGRLRTDLAAAHARGEDLGSRAAHIQAGGERLLELSRAFEDAIDDLGCVLGDLGVQDKASCEALRQFLGSVQTLVKTAQHFPSGL